MGNLSVISEGDRVTTFAKTDPKRSVFFVALSTKDNTKILEFWNLDSNKQLTGINVNQKYQQKD